MRPLERHKRLVGGGSESPLCPAAEHDPAAPKGAWGRGGSCRSRPGMDVTRYVNQRVRAAFVQLFKAAARALDLAGMISARTKTAPCCRQASETRSEANGDTA